MSNNRESNEANEIIGGFLLLIYCHMIAGVLIFVAGLVAGSFLNNYAFLAVWIYGYLGLGLWQLVYVIPLLIRFQRRRKTGRMKGMIVGAVLTALVNGACYLSTWR